MIAKALPEASDWGTGTEIQQSNLLSRRRNTTACCPATQQTPWIYIACWSRHSFEAWRHLADVVPLGLLEIHQKVIKSAVVVVGPMILDTCASQESHISQNLSLLRQVKCQVRSRHLVLICTESTHLDGCLLLRSLVALPFWSYSTCCYDRTNNLADIIAEHVMNIRMSTPVSFIRV